MVDPKRLRNRKPNAAQDHPIVAQIVDPEPDHNFTRQVRHVQDGEALIAAHFTARWGALNGAILSEAELHKNECEEATAFAKKLWREAEAGLQRTPRYKTVTVEQKDDGTYAPLKVAPFRDWPLRDKIVSLSAGVSGIALLGLGATNVASTILASGEPVFIEAPVLAYLVGGIIPALSIGVKSGYSLFESRAWKKKYAVCVNAAMVFFGLCWTALFAMTFEGVSAGFDVESLGESEGHPALLTAVQLLTEITAGAALFICVEDCFDNNRKKQQEETQEWREAKKAVADREAAYEAALKRSTEAVGLWQCLKDKRDVYVNEAIADWRSLQASQARS